MLTFAELKVIPEETDAETEHFLKAVTEDIEEEKDNLQV